MGWRRFIIVLVAGPILAILPYGFIRDPREIPTPLTDVQDAEEDAQAFLREFTITHKHVGALGWKIITTKLDEAIEEIISAGEGKGDYRAIR